MERAFPDPAQLFDHGLRLLVQQLGVDRAVMTRVTKLGYESFWWATAEGIQPDQAIHDPAQNFCPKVIQNPSRSLVIRDALSDKELQGHSAFRKLGVRAYIGVPLRHSSKIIGVLSVQSARPRAFTRSEIAVVNAMANLLGKTMEIENLKPRAPHDPRGPGPHLRGGRGQRPWRRPRTACPTGTTWISGSRRTSTWPGPPRESRCPSPSGTSRSSRRPRPP